MNEAGKLANASLPFGMKCYTVERTALRAGKAVLQEVLHNTVFSTVDLAVESMRKRAAKDTNALSQVIFHSPTLMEIKDQDEVTEYKYEVKEHEFDDGKLG